jgi:Flp pilus assembly protein TadG
MRRRGNWRGNATIEFTLVGIPLVFVLISTIEMARGMWIYHTLAYAIKEGTRYTIVRGQNNTTGHATYPSVCDSIVKAGAGLLPEALTLTFQSVTTTSEYTTTADKCKAGLWPPAGTDASGNLLMDDIPGQTISISGSYPFVSLIAMFWPGGGQASQFAATNFLASSREVMQF